MGYRFNKVREASLRASAAERQRKADRERKYKNTSASETVNVNDVDAPFRIIDGKQVDAKWNGNNWYWD